jgi:hypothetical protein
MFLYLLTATSRWTYDFTDNLYFTLASFSCNLDSLFGIIQLKRHNFQNLSYFVCSTLHHTDLSSFKCFILHPKSIKISKYQT